MESAAIIIPARYGSSRFPGKPLALIAGKTMLERVVETARQAAAEMDDCAVWVATEDARIADFSAKKQIPCLLTPDTCNTGTDRVYAAALLLDETPEIILNLQGDAPFTPISHLTHLLQYLREHPEADMATPVAPLSWEALDQIRHQKETTPFSGTTCVRDAKGHALWFSKQILPAMRKEATLRQQQPLSPILQHIGLYGYRFETLQRFIALPEGQYEALEGLEQLRCLEHGIDIHTVTVEANNLLGISGIDSPEDVARAEVALESQL